MKDMTAYDRFLERQRIADERARKMGYGKAMQDAIEPAPAQPLTDEQIVEYFEEHVDTGSLLSFADGVRFAEAAHGITKGGA